MSDELPTSLIRLRLGQEDGALRGQPRRRRDPAEDRG